MQHGFSLNRRLRPVRAGASYHWVERRRARNLFLACNHTNDVVMGDYVLAKADHAAGELGVRVLIDAPMNYSELRSKLRAGADSPTDDQVCDLVLAWSTSYNAEGAAIESLAAVASVCYFRQHLAPRLLHLPLEALWAMGVADSHHLQCWVEAYLRRPRFSRSPTLLEGLAGPEGLAWLRVELPHLSEAVDELFAEIPKRRISGNEAV